MKTITHNTLFTMLSEIRGTTFAKIVTDTDPKLRKTGNPFSGVRKVSHVNVCLGFQYENSVNRQRGREEIAQDFESAPRAWGTKISPMFIEHKGKLYLETKIERSLSTSYVDATGRELTSEDVAPFLPKRSSSSRQGVEKKVLIRDYAMDSIRSITINGESYKVA